MIATLVGIGAFFAGWILRGVMTDLQARFHARMALAMYVRGQSAPAPRAPLKEDKQ